MKNGYTNTTERVSYQIEISVCNRSKDRSCKSSYMIDKLLSNIYFTMYVATGRVELMKTGVHNSSPIRILDKFH